MSQSPSNLVRIVIDGHVAEVQAPAALVVPFLAVPVRRFETGPDGSPTAVQDVEVFAVERLGRIVISPGLVPLLVSRLQARGITVEIVDRRVLPPHLTVSAGAMICASVGDRPLLESLVRNSRGQIEVANTGDMLRAIRLIGRTFPSCNLLILSATLRRAKQLWRELRNQLPGQVQLARKAWTKKSRIVCSTLSYDRDPGQWQIILIPDAHELASGTAVEKVATAFRGPQRIYAFVRRGWRPRPLEAMAVQNVAGPVIHHTQITAAINLQVCRAAEFPVLNAQPGLEQKRLVWHHDARNDLLARIATAFAHRDQEALWMLGLMLQDSDTQWLAEVGSGIKVTVLVESTEHGKQLQRRLEGWPLLALLPTTPPAAASMGQRLRGLGTLVTQAYASQYGIEADVVVRADGGDKLVIPGFPPAASGGVDSVVVVELEDGLVRPPQPEHRRQDVQARRRQAGRAAAGKGVKKKARSSTKQPRPGRSRQSDHGLPGDAGLPLPNHPTLDGNPAPPHPEAATAPDHSSPGDLPERRVLTPPSTTGRSTHTGVHVRPTRLGTDRRGRAPGAETPDGSADQAELSGD